MSTSSHYDLICNVKMVYPSRSSTDVTEMAIKIGIEGDATHLEEKKALITNKQELIKKRNDFIIKL